MHAIARELGIPEVTLKRWAESHHGQPRTRQATFHEVTVREERPVLHPVLVLPGGARVEGLDLADVVELIRLLG
jgi:hypothetical protein